MPVQWPFLLVLGFPKWASCWSPSGTWMTVAGSSCAHQRASRTWRRPLRPRKSSQLHLMLKKVVDLNSTAHLKPKLEDMHFNLWSVALWEIQNLKFIKLFWSDLTGQKASQSWWRLRWVRLPPQRPPAVIPLLLLAVLHCPTVCQLLSLSLFLPLNL